MLVIDAIVGSFRAADFLVAGPIVAGSNPASAIEQGRPL